MTRYYFAQFGWLSVLGLLEEQAEQKVLKGIRPNHPESFELHMRTVKQLKELPGKLEPVFVFNPLFREFLE